LYPHREHPADLIFDDIVKFWTKFLTQLFIESVTTGVLLIITTCYFSCLINKLFSNDHFKEQKQLMKYLTIFYILFIIRVLLTLTLHNLETVVIHVKKQNPALYHWIALLFQVTWNAGPMGMIFYTHHKSFSSYHKKELAREQMSSFRSESVETLSFH